MEKLEHDVARLLRSAATVPEEAFREPPFGFATRVVGLWRAAKNNDSGEIVRLLRRVAAAAAAIALVATVFTYRQMNENDEIDEPLTNDYAIADSAIQAEFLQ
jgi:hypothetical protein